MSVIGQLPRLKASFGITNEKVRDVAKSARVIDAFDVVSVKSSSPFSKARPPVIDPLVKISEEGERKASSVWWSDDLLRLVPAHNKEATPPDNALPPEIACALKLLAKDKTYLVVNWYHDI